MNMLLKSCGEVPELLVELVPLVELVELGVASGLMYTASS
jgi:hypothetical protein